MDAKECGIIGDGESVDTFEIQRNEAKRIVESMKGKTIQCAGYKMDKDCAELTFTDGTRIQTNVYSGMLAFNEFTKEQTTVRCSVCNEPIFCPHCMTGAGT